MKILMIVDSWSERVSFSGTGAIFRLIRKIAKFGIEVHILCALKKPYKKIGKEILLPENEGKLFVHFYDLRWISISGFPYLTISRFYCFFNIIKLCQKYDFDIIHDYSSSPLLFLLDAHFFLTGKKIIHTICTKSRLNLFENSFFWKGIKFTHKVIITSNYFAEKIKSRVVSQSKVLYLSLGVELERFQAQTRRSKKLRIVYVGPGERRKGADLFFELARKINLCNFVWVVAKKNKRPDKVRIIEGVVDIAKMYSECDIAVFPYRSLEGVLLEPQTLLEAMASGKAIVVADFPQIREISGESVLYFTPGDLASLVDKVNILSKSKSERLKLGKKAREIAKNKLDAEKSALKLVNLYKEILND